MEKLQETVDFLKKETNDFSPEVAIILGSGLGSFCDGLEGISIPYSNIPNFPTSSIEGHKGELLFCEIKTKNSSKKCVVAQGRFHFYEGYTMREVVYPIKVFKKLGVKYLFITNAAGALSKSFKVGDIMMLEDQINLMGTNPLIGPMEQIDGFGVRFPDMSQVYCEDLKDLALNCACDVNIDLIKGVYLATTGPSYETKAEVKAYKILGADAVGMSSAPEAIVANNLGMKIVGFSLITNLATGVSDKKLSHQEVLEIGKTSGKKLCDLIKRMIYKIDDFE